MSENRPPTEDERIERMLAAIRQSFPSPKSSLRQFLPKYLADKLAHARLLFLQFKHKVPERAIALTAVSNLLDQMERVNGGPFKSLIGVDEGIRARLKEMIGQFSELPQESISFAPDRDLHHRLQMAAELTGVHIRQIVATGVANLLAELETLYGRSFSESRNVAADNQTSITDEAPPMKDDPMIVDAAQCPKCRDIVAPRWDQDLHGCGCGAIAITGGPTRSRVLWEEPNRPISITVIIAGLEELRASPGVWAAASTEPRKYRLIEGRLEVVQ